MTLSYPERDVTVTFTSIFIPGDVKNSSLPAVLMRVKGAGRLMFLLNGKYKAVPRIGGRSVILHSDEGGIGLMSMRGLARSYRTADRYNVLRMPMNGHISNPPAQPDPDKPDDLFAAMDRWGQVPYTLQMANPSLLGVPPRLFRQFIRQAASHRSCGLIHG